jgi:geranylgeranyl pyrophosphate synthase
MTAPLDPIPLQNHRACLQEHLHEIAVGTNSVAGRIIEERLASTYVSDPVRPSLVLWACEAANGNVADAVPVAVAFDLFDRFLLLHDELANDSTPTIGRWGLGQSLNAGDALYALAFRSLASGVVNPATRAEAARLVAEAVLRAIEQCNERLAREAALTSAALQAGAVIAQAPDHAVRTFAEAGRRLVTDPLAAVELVRRCASSNDLATFEEVARYVARRAA